MDLVGEQSVKLCNDFLKKNQRPEMNPQQKNRIILAVRDCADSDYHIRMILGTFQIQTSALYFSYLAILTIFRFCSTPHSGLRLRCYYSW